MNFHTVLEREKTLTHIKRNGLTVFNSLCNAASCFVITIYVYIYTVCLDHDLFYVTRLLGCLLSFLHNNIHVVPLLCHLFLPRSIHHQKDVGATGIKKYSTSFSADTYIYHSFNILYVTYTDFFTVYKQGAPVLVKLNGRLMFLLSFVIASTLLQTYCTTNLTMYISLRWIFLQGVSRKCSTIIKVLFICMCFFKH